MDIPETLPQVFFFVALVVPGVAFITVRDAILGPRSASSVPARILESLFISVIFDAVYLGIIGGFYGQISARNFAFVQSHLALVSLLLLLLSVLLPVAVAFAVFSFVPALRSGLNPFKSRASTYVNIPSAWDFVAKQFADTQFVRVLLPTGRWVGGLFANGSFVSTFPQPHDIYIEEEWEMGPGGEFIEPLSSRTGLWLPIGPALLVEWLPIPDNEDQTGVGNGK
jgi:hypothetical protein